MTDIVKSGKNFSRIRAFVVGMFRAGCDTHCVHHMSRILDGDVAGRPRCERTAAHIGQLRIKPGNAALQSRQNIRKPYSTGVGEFSS
jgi:hypothetical protein